MSCTDVQIVPTGEEATQLPEDLNHSNNQATGERPKNRRRKLLCELLSDFAKNTTLHGLRYVTERGLSVVEKIFWFLTFLTSLSICVFLMHNVWVKWRTSPVIVTLSEKLMSVTEVPFPAVTICPQAKIRQSSFNYTKFHIEHDKIILEQLMNNSNPKDIKSFLQTRSFARKLHDLNIICNEKYSIAPFKFSSYADHISMNNIQETVPRLRDILRYGVWRNDYFAGYKNFDMVLTQEGVCYTFNSLAAEEIFYMERIQTNYSYLSASTRQKGWSLKDGYSTFGNDVYPRRGRANSVKPDLTLHLKEILDRDVLCDGTRRGFKVYLHHPADLPQSSLYYYAVVPKQITSFAIKTSVMNTTDTLSKYPPDITSRSYKYKDVTLQNGKFGRQCYFPWEKELRYFRVYTMNNCQLECSANYTLKLCGCIWFHMPHYNSTTICLSTRVGCVIEALEQLAAGDNINNNNISPCRCLPLCITIKYEAEVVKTSYDVSTFLKVQEDTISSIYSPNKENNGSRNDHYDKIRPLYAQIDMYFKEPRFVAMRRSELFGLTDFLANCGGLLGLFLGFSFLSLVEIVYFLTLRFGCNLRRDNMKHKMEIDHFKII